MASDALTHGSGTDSGTASAASAGAAAGGVRASPQASPSPPAAGAAAEARLQHPQPQQQSLAPDRAGSTGPESGGNALPPAPSMAARRKRRSSGDPNSGGAAAAGPGAAAAGSPPQAAAMAASAKEAAASAASAFAVAAAATGSPVMVVGEPSKSVPEFQLTTRTSSKPDPRKQDQSVWFGIPESEQLLDEFHCALRKRVLLQGRLFVFENFVCFHTNLFGYEKKKVIFIPDIAAVRKKAHFRIPNSIEIEDIKGNIETFFTSFLIEDIRGNIEFFTSFLARDSAYRLIVDQWSLSRPRPTISGNLGFREHPNLPHGVHDIAEDTSPAEYVDGTFDRRSGFSPSTSPPTRVAAASSRLAEASRQLSSGGFRRGATSYSNAGAAAVAAAAAAGAAGVGAGAGSGASHPPQAGAASHAPPTVGGAAAVGPTARDEAALDQARALRGRSASPNRHRGLGHDSGQSAVGGVRLGRGLTVDFEYPSPRGDVEDEGDMLDPQAIWSVAEEGPMPPRPPDSKLLMTTKLPGTPQMFYETLLSDGSQFSEDVYEALGYRRVMVSSWKRAERLGHIRDVQFVAPLKGRFTAWGVAKAQCFLTQRVCNYQNQVLVFEAQQTNMDVPYGDCYTVNIRWEVRAVATPDASMTDAAQQPQQPQQPGSAVATGAQQPADPSVSAAGGGAAATGAGPVAEAATATAGAGVSEGVAAAAGAGAPGVAAVGAVGGGGSLPQVHLDIYVSVPFSRMCVFKKVIESSTQVQIRETTEVVVARAREVLYEACRAHHGGAAGSLSSGSAAAARGLLAEERGDGPRSYAPPHFQSPGRGRHGRHRRQNSADSRADSRLDSRVEILRKTDLGSRLGIGVWGRSGSGGDSRGRRLGSASLSAGGGGGGGGGVMGLLRRWYPSQRGSRLQRRSDGSSSLRPLVLLLVALMSAVLLVQVVMVALWVVRGPPISHATPSAPNPDPPRGLLGLGRTVRQLIASYQHRTAPGSGLGLGLEGPGLGFGQPDASGAGGFAGAGASTAAQSDASLVSDCAAGFGAGFNDATSGPAVSSCVDQAGSDALGSAGAAGAGPAVGPTAGGGWCDANCLQRLERLQQEVVGVLGRVEGLATELSDLVASTAAGVGSAGADGGGA